MPKVVEPITVFNNKFNGRKRITMNAGESEIVIRKPRKVDGKLVIEDTKELFPLHDYIQSFRDSVDIEVLLKRFAAGDQSVLDQFSSRKAADYTDLTVVPDNIHDMMDLANKGLQLFNELPTEKKELFDNNYEKFIFEAGSDEWYKKMGFENEKVVGETSGSAEEVKAGDSAEG